MYEINKQFTMHFLYCLCLFSCFYLREHKPNFYYYDVIEYPTIFPLLDCLTLKARRPRLPHYLIHSWGEKRFRIDISE